MIDYPDYQQKDRYFTSPNEHLLKYTIVYFSIL